MFVFSETAKGFVLSIHFWYLILLRAFWIKRGTLFNWSSCLNLPTFENPLPEMPLVSRFTWFFIIELKPEPVTVVTPVIPYRVVMSPYRPGIMYIVVAKL